MDRLERDGHVLDLRRRVAMPVVSYFFVQLPIAAGNWAGHRAERRRGSTPLAPVEQPAAGR
jgi:hypothetical protein